MSLGNTPVPPTAPESPLPSSSRVVSLLRLTSLSIVGPGSHIWRLERIVAVTPGADSIKHH